MQWVEERGAANCPCRLPDSCCEAHNTSSNHSHAWCVSFGFAVQPWGLRFEAAPHVIQQHGRETAAAGGCWAGCAAASASAGSQQAYMCRVCDEGAGSHSWSAGSEWLLCCARDSLGVLLPSCVEQVRGTQQQACH